MTNEDLELAALKAAEETRAAVARAEKAEASTIRLVILATRLGATEGQLAEAHGDRLTIREIQDNAGVRP